MKTAARQIRHRRIRATVTGTADRPRVVVFRGAKTLSVQLIDDTVQQPRLSLQAAQRGLAGATALGTALAKQAKTQKINRVVFDRAGYQYHGLVKAVAEAARQEGLVI